MKKTFFLFLVLNLASFQMLFATPTATPGTSASVTVDAGIAATPVILHFQNGIFIGHTP